MEKKNIKTAKGLVEEALPNGYFKVKLEGTAEEMITHLSGKMRIHRIKVLVGDHVSVEFNDYGGKGRIIKRF